MDLLLFLSGCLLLLLLCPLKGLHFSLLIPFLLDLLLLIRLAFLLISDPLLLFVDDFVFLWLLSRPLLVLAFVTCRNKLSGFGVTKGLFFEGEVLEDVLLGQLPLNHLLLRLRDLGAILVRSHYDMNGLGARRIALFVRYCLNLMLTAANFCGQEVTIRQVKDGLLVGHLLSPLFLLSGTLL